ncbi:MAG: hypothetical protein NVSMB22_07230 [Chloroflexota bacterium]
MEDNASHNPFAALETSFNARRTRRTFLQGAAATGVAATGIGLLTQTAGAQAQPADTIATILNVAATAETLAVTFYTNGVNNAQALGLTGGALNDIKAALIEEQIHLNFFVANGGKAAAQTFSFPKGPATFTDIGTFISTQQQLEGVFDSAFIAASYEFVQLGHPELARIAVQIAMIESEHRALGRDIANDRNVSLDVMMAGTASPTPADNWAFAPQTIASVGAAPALVQAAGYLSPSGTNSFTFQDQTANFTSPLYADVYSRVVFRAPFVAGTPLAATPVRGWNAKSKKHSKRRHGGHR